MIVNDKILIVIAMILIFVDIFLSTDITTLVAYIIFSFLIAHNINVPIIYQIGIGILAWWGMVAIHYYVFRKYIRRFIDVFVAPTKIQSGIAIHFGKTGEVKMIENRLLFQIEDEIYPFSEQGGRQCKHGDNATIISYLNGKLIIKLNN